MRLRAKVTASVVTTVLVAAGLGACSGETETPAGAVQVAGTLGPGEGTVNLLTLSGLVENGGSDPRVDWVTPFEERTGCKVGWKIARDAEEMGDLMRDKDRRYDGVSAPPEVSGALIAERQVVPVNAGLVDGYKKLEPRLRGLLKKDGRFYGVPYVWGSNLLMYDPAVVQPAPSSWAALFEPGQARRHSGRLVMRDSPLGIAEAALYLKRKERKLRITDPYSLTPKQLNAAARVLAAQRPHVKQYWQLPAETVSTFAGGGTGLGGRAGAGRGAGGSGGDTASAALGQGWPYQVDVLNRSGRPVQGAIPSEGVTGWMNAWMFGARAQHPNCMYQWLQWTASPDVQQQVAEWSGVAPANPQACSGDRLKRGFCDAYRVGDRAHLEKVIFAHTPTRTCGGGDGDGDKRDCTDYAEWTKKWNEATGK